MPKFLIPNEDRVIIATPTGRRGAIKKDAFNRFNESILGLGTIGMKSIPLNALSVIFDLEGFTNFCKQIDPQLAVPEYLSQFLNWIFEQVKTELVEEERNEGFLTWSELPILSKYLGDGLLFLWNTEMMNETQIANVIVSMLEICQNYVKEFLPKMSKIVVSPPAKLRCGIARGIVYSVGDGNDFVGPCINMSARLQKLHSLTFCFSRRGLDPKALSASYAKDFVVKKVDIRGIGGDELVCILKNEYDKLTPEEKKGFLKI
ncbi:hypothetical protein [Dyadobacter pollutisoli]|uniref:Guanylate cyclase domain-containing protein n=1 Tax=Dyadobacter pollutisoli TaxID=2910158 RepID=A0A9E8NAK3_9BACT|nr:hypothetical protein [Dyadobacter pollutisoli]WAC11511.1 hypothetical protein ON006_27745 [Dyadobacter pollutisoli]